MFCDTSSDAEHWFLSLDIARAGLEALSMGIGPRNRTETWLKIVVSEEEKVLRIPLLDASIDYDNSDKKYIES